MRTPHAATRRHSRRRADERGSVTLEWVILFPLVLLMLFGFVQGSLYWYAQSVAATAAQEGVKAARTENGTAGDGIDRASKFADQTSGTSLLTDRHITGSRSADEARVTVTGKAITLIPGFGGFPVSRTASGPVERITEEP